MELELETDLMKELELDFIFLRIRIGTRFPVLYTCESLNFNLDIVLGNKRKKAWLEPEVNQQFQSMLVKTRLESGLIFRNETEIYY